MVNKELMNNEKYNSIEYNGFIIKTTKESPFIYLLYVINSLTNKWKRVRGMEGYKSEEEALNAAKNYINIFGKRHIKEDIIKPTLSKPMSKQSQGFEKNFKRIMSHNAPDIQLDEIDGTLSEAEQSLKKKIFSLSKMEALVHSDPTLSSVYDEMSINGEEKYGYHWNETIMNMIFNDYVLNDPKKYLIKYKQAIPVQKKRRDQSGINQLKKAGEEKMQHKSNIEKPKKLEPSGLPKQEKKPEVTDETILGVGLEKTSENIENDESKTPVVFLVNEKDPEDPDLFAYFPEENYDRMGNKQMGYSHIGQHSAVDPAYAEESREATPEEYQDLKTELESIGYNLEILNQANESTGAVSSGAFSAPLGTIRREIDEYTDSKGNFQQNINVEAEDEPQDDDCYISSNGWVYSVSCSDKFIGKFNEIDDALAAVKTWKASNKWYPNTWFVSDHGNMSLIDDEGNILNETTGTGGGTGLVGGKGASGNGESGTGPYYTPSAWGDGDLMKVKGKAPVKTKPMFPGGTIIQENKTNYLVDPSGFEKYIKTLNEDAEATYDNIGKQYQSTHPKSNKGMGVSPIVQGNDRKKKEKDISDNTMLFVDQDVDLMSDKDVNILHKDMTDKNSFFPHPDNKNLPEDGIAGKIKKENINMEQNQSNNKITTPEQLKAFVAQKKAQGGKGLMKEDIPMLAGQALYNVAINTANRYLASKGIPTTWNELGDINSMWDYIDKNGGMTFEDFQEAVESATNDRLSDEGMGFNDLDESKKINEKAKSAKQQQLFGMAHAVQKGELSPSKVGGAVKKIAKDVSPKDVEDFAKTKHKGLPEKVSEETQTIISDNPESMSNKAVPTGTQSSNMDTGAKSTSGGMSENKELNKNITAMSENDIKLLEEIDKELSAYSIHQAKLKKMSEDRKPSALVLRDRVGSENEKNFKSDMQDSDTKQIIDVEKELQWKDQQTEVGDDPQKLGQELEKKEIKTTDAKGDEHLKNVGNSANDKGDEVPKRNMTTDEQDEVNMYRLGQHSLVYDNKPDQRFEDRMKKDMGDKVYDIRQKQLKFRAKAPMYNKDTQPIETAPVDKSQFNKEKSMWNQREGLKEGAVTGKYFNDLGKKKILDFNLSNVKEITDEKAIEKLKEVDFAGMGNTYTNKVDINENVIIAINKYKFYTDGADVFAIKKPVQKLNENEQKEKIPVNEEFNKIKHLLDYKPNDYVDTKSTKKNRGF